MRAGLYLVRVSADPEHRLIETKENDNAAYALIEVTEDDRVVVCELGRGTSPWDPRRTVVPDAFLWADRLRDPGLTPEQC